MKSTILTRLIMACSALLLAAVLFSAQSMNNPQPAAAGCGDTDKFGYTLTCAALGPEHVYKDVSTDGGTLVIFENYDDSISNAIPIGFSFKYYENTYTAVYAGTNGVLFFDQVDGAEVLRYARIPRSTTPHNLLAPFWADLFIGGAGGDLNQGEVYYKAYNTPIKHLVIQYKNVTLVEDGGSPLNFEVILYENGNVDFFYQTLTGDLATASIGIEDSDGVDGIQYLYRETGLTPGRVLHFARPAQDYRVKALSEAESSLVVSGKAEVKLAFRNAGDKGNDVIEFPAVSLPAGWTYSLLNAATRTSLLDTDGNGVKDSGTLAPGADITILVRVFGPANSAPGVTTAFTLAAQSKNKISQKAETELRFSVPPAFAYAYSKITSLNGMTYGAVSNRRRSEFSLVVNYTGNSLGITPLAGQRMLYVWEKSGFNLIGTATTYLTAMILDEYGGVRRNAWVPTTNDYNTVPVFTMDSTPAMAQNPGGNKYVGLFYRHVQNNVDSLYLTILDTNGNIIPVGGSNKIDVTQPNNSQPFDYQSPAIAATANGRFVLAWTSTYSDTLTNMTDIWTASFDANTLAQIKAPAKVTSAVTGSKSYGDPVLTPMDDGRVLLAYSVYETSGTHTGYVEWVALDSAGSKSGSPVNYKVTAASNDPNTILQKDVTQLYSGGPILLAWVDSGAETIRAVLLNNALTGSLTPPVTLLTPNQRTPGNLSVTYTREGYGVLLWEDVTSSQYIFYSLISSGTGQILTPTTTLVKTDQVGLQTITASLSAQGLAPIEGFNQINLPTVYDTYSPALMSADEEEAWQP